MCLGRLNIGWSVWLHVNDGEVQDRKSALSLRNTCRKFHTAKILILGVERFKQHIAEHIVVDPGFDLFHHVLVVDISIHLRLVLTGECQNVGLLSAHGL